MSSVVWNAELTLEKFLYAWEHTAANHIVFCWITFSSPKVLWVSTFLPYWGGGAPNSHRKTKRRKRRKVKWSNHPSKALQMTLLCCKLLQSNLTSKLEQFGLECNSFRIKCTSPLKIAFQFFKKFSTKASFTPFPWYYMGQYSQEKGQWESSLWKCWCAESWIQSEKCLETFSTEWKG